MAAKDDKKTGPASAEPGEEKSGSSTIPGTPGGDPGDPAGPARFKHGDRVAFQNGEVEGEGVIVASGNDGVIVQDDAQREHKVRHGRIIRKLAGGDGESAEKKPAGKGPAAASGDVKKAMVVFPKPGAPAPAPAVRKSDFGGDFGGVPALVFAGMAAGAAQDAAAAAIAPGANAAPGHADQPRPNLPDPGTPPAAGPAAADAAGPVETEGGVAKEREDGRAGYVRSALRALQNFWNPGAR